MAKKTDDARARKVGRATEGALRWLGFLQQYDVIVDFVDKFENFPPDEQPNARLNYTYPYRSVCITWRRYFVDHASLEAIEECAIHEALHLLLFGGIRQLVEESLDNQDKYRHYCNFEESGVDLATRYLMRRRPRYGYHSSGVPNTKKTAKEPKRRSTR